MSEHLLNWVQKNDPGSREVRKGQNCAPDPLEALPDPKNPMKNKKIQVLGGYMENSRSTALAAAILLIKAWVVGGVGLSIRSLGHTPINKGIQNGRQPKAAPL